MDKELFQDIALLAKREKKPKAEVIRAVLKKGLAKQKPNAGTFLLSLAKNPIKGLDPKLSTEIDTYLYKD